MKGKGIQTFPSVLTGSLHRLWHLLCQDRWLLRVWYSPVTELLPFLDSAISKKRFLFVFGGEQSLMTEALLYDPLDVCVTFGQLPAYPQGFPTNLRYRNPLLPVCYGWLVGGQKWIRRRTHNLGEATETLREGPLRDCFRVVLFKWELLRPAHWLPCERTHRWGLAGLLFRRLLFEMKTPRAGRTHWPDLCFHSCHGG